MRLRNKVSGTGVYLRGGLGNQLFGWATAYAVSRRAQLPLTLLAEQIPRKTGIADVRSFELDYFGLAPGDNRGLRQWVSGLLALFGEETERVVSEIGFEFDERVVQIKDSATLQGYFQNPRYFQDYRDEITNFLWKNARRGSCVGDFLARFGENWVAVHVRRGDYERLAHVYNLPGARYYKQGLTFLEREMGPSKVVVFSDDVETARRLVPEAEEYVGPSDFPRVGDSLILMASATSLIGANSSLSWWAGYLSCDGAGRRVFPDRWFRYNLPSSRGLLLDDWVSVGAMEE